jgi:hypothetical protein
VHGRRAHVEKPRIAARSLKTQQRAKLHNAEVDVILGEPVGRTVGLEKRRPIDGPAATGVIAPESLERR